MKPMDRRTFLRRTGIVVAGSAAVGLGAGAAIPNLLHRFHRPWDDDAFAPPGRPKVLVARVDSYDGDLETTVEDGLREVGASLAGRSVLLKPNLVEYDPGTVINTDPRLVAATVLARAATRRVLGARRRGAGAPARHPVRGLGVRSGRAPAARSARGSST